MFVLLFAALKVAGQTTGYLRFDTVRIMKQNGTCELYLINKTKDSLGLLTNVGGGLTQFKRSRALTDSTFIIGNDTLKILGRPGSGGSGSDSTIYKINGEIDEDRTLTQAGHYLRFQQAANNYTQFNGALQTIQPDSTSMPFYTKIIKSPYSGPAADGILEWREGFGASLQAPARPNYPYMQGFNLTPGGGAFVAGLPALGRSIEPHYLTDPGSPTLWLMEWHDMYVEPNGTQRRLMSYTINTRDSSWNMYRVMPSWALRSTNGTDYLFATTANRTDHTSILTLKAGNGATEAQFIANGTEDMLTINSSSAGQFQFSNFTQLDFGGGSAYDVTNSIWGIGRVSQGFDIVRATQPYGFHFKNSALAADDAAFTVDGNTGEARNYVSSGYFNTFYGGGSEVIRLSTTGNALIGQTTDNANGKLQITGTTTINGTEADAIHVKGSNAGRRTILIDNADASALASLHVRNNRGNFDTYGAILTGGSSATSTIFGLTQADKTFVVHDGANGLGMGVGTMNNQAMIFGTNNTERARITGAGAITFNTSTNSYTFPSTRATAGQVLTDAAGNGTLSWAAPSAAITSINSQTGPAITIQGGTGTSATTTTNTVTIEVVPSSAALPHTLDALYTTQGNTGTSETDLFSYTLPANRLGIDGRTVNFEIDGEVNDATATAQIKLHVAGNTTLNTGAVNISTAPAAWRLKGYIIRTSSTTAHVTYELDCLGLATQKFIGYSNLTSLDFTTTNIIKISAQAGGAGAGNSDITAHSWQLLYKPQPQ